MAPTIRIDNEVYAWLQTQARPFEDTPNSVLRRVAGIGSNDVSEENAEVKQRVLKTTKEKGQKTPQGDFRPNILKLLKDHGGEVHRGVALKELGQSMAAQLTEYDKEEISSGTIRWQKSAEWEVRIMREEGILKPVIETARGVWALVG
jgi:hypothetical protein